MIHFKFKNNQTGVVREILFASDSIEYAELKDEALAVRFGDPVGTTYSTVYGKTVEIDDFLKKNSYSKQKNPNLDEFFKKHSYPKYNVKYKTSKFLGGIE